MLNFAKALRRRGADGLGRAIGLREGTDISSPSPPDPCEVRHSLRRSIAVHHFDNRRHRQRGFSQPVRRVFRR